MNPIPIYAYFPREDLLRAEEDERRKARATHYVTQPLAMACVLESARLHQAGRLQQVYDFSWELFSSVPALLAAVERGGPGPCLFSNYVWSLEESLVASQAVKALQPRCVTVHGGPSTPAYPDACAAFLAQHPHVDLAVRGEGEATIVEVLDALAPSFQAGAPPDPGALERCAGLTFLRREDARRVRTADRPVLHDLDALPSPYLTGFFDRAEWSPAECGYVFVTLETNRGCPYGCIYCDWGSGTLQKIRCFSLDRVRAELEWLAERKVERVFVSDANFGILPRDREIAGMIADVKRRHGYPLIVTTNYAKNGATRLPEIFRIWKEAGIVFDSVVSIQTTDAQTLQTIRRANIKTHKYTELANAYRELKLPTTVQLMMGLPGATVEAWKRDLQLYFDRQEDVQFFATRLLPNSPMADPAYLAEQAIETDELGNLVACRSYTREDYRLMGSIGITFGLFANWGLLRWLLLHLQWDHRVPALEVIADVAARVQRGDPEHPELQALLGPLVEAGSSAYVGAKVGRFEHYFRGPDGWSGLYAELRRYLRERFAVEASTAFETALQVQQALRPVKGQPMPRQLALRHDFAAYLREGLGAAWEAGGSRPGGGRPLGDYGPGMLLITDPFSLCAEEDTEWLPSANEMNPGWELKSALRDTEPSPEFLSAKILAEKKRALRRAAAG